MLTGQTADYELKHRIAECSIYLRRIAELLFSNGLAMPH
jgi:hypothetical protein